MRPLLAFVLVLAGCTSQPSAPTPVPTSSPIALPSFAQLSAPSGTVVWALVAGTRLFRSLDRGDTWAERSLPPGLANIEVSFADDTIGVLLSAGSPASSCQTQTAAIWKTVDAAISWQQVSAAGIADAMCKRGLASGGPSRAFFTAYGPNSGPVIYRTVEIGQTWTAARPLPAFEPGAPVLARLFQRMLFLISIALVTTRLIQEVLTVAAPWVPPMKMLLYQMFVGEAEAELS